MYFGGREPLLINDTHSHPLTLEKSVIYSSNIHSYLGVPILYKNGDMFGALCVMDSIKGDFKEEDFKILEKFSALFTSVIELEKQVTFDSLTGLYTRNYFYENFDNFINKGTLMLLDLDGFKQVNDNNGHDVGDIVLKEVAERITEILSEDGIGVRIGGDEFVIYFPNLIDTSSIKDKGKSIKNALSDWESIPYNVNISASIGIVKFESDELNLSTLLKVADTAMYHAKNKGKNSCHFLSI
ncbi:sensor domain-containing diguanylate cyclase [Salipaludibacillus neizhouensis]|nr:sensor domain-containing diguanylate cyclase [Salipaludibacillus neizhouensis]